VLVVVVQAAKGRDRFDAASLRRSRDWLLLDGSFVRWRLVAKAHVLAREMLEARLADDWDAVEELPGSADANDSRPSVDHVPCDWSSHPMTDAELRDQMIVSAT
jgi:hypothetical protein